MATLIESNPSFTIELFRDDIAMVMKSIGNKEYLRLFCNFLGINLEKCQLPKTTFSWSLALKEEKNPRSYLFMEDLLSQLLSCLVFLE